MPVHSEADPASPATRPPESTGACGRFRWEPRQVPEDVFSSGAKNSPCPLEVALFCFVGVVPNGHDLANLGKSGREIFFAHGC
jgi:hypothetical protein